MGNKSVRKAARASASTAKSGVGQIKKSTGAPKTQEIFSTTQYLNHATTEAMMELLRAANAFSLDTQTRIDRHMKFAEKSSGLNQIPSDAEAAPGMKEIDSTARRMHRHSAKLLAAEEKEMNVLIDEILPLCMAALRGQNAHYTKRAAKKTASVAVTKIPAIGHIIEALQWLRDALGQRLQEAEDMASVERSQLAFQKMLTRAGICAELMIGYISARAKMRQTGKAIVLVTIAVAQRRYASRAARHKIELS